MAFTRLYRYKDRVIIPTVVQAEEGFFMDVDPVTICDTADLSLLRERIAEALTRTNAVVPTPDRAHDPGSAILEKLRLRKWRVFESDATMFTIYRNPDGVEYYSSGPAVSGEWKLARGKHISLPADTPVEQLVDLIVREVQEEIGKAAGGSSTSGGLMLLPAPEEE